MPGENLGFITNIYCINSRGLLAVQVMPVKQER